MRTTPPRPRITWAMPPPVANTAPILLVNRGSVHACSHSLSTHCSSPAAWHTVPPVSSGHAHALCAVTTDRVAVVDRRAEDQGVRPAEHVLDGGLGC